VPIPQLGIEARELYFLVLSDPELVPW
jgi:hypothetical protein